MKRLVAPSALLSTMPESQWQGYAGGHFDGSAVRAVDMRRSEVPSVLRHMSMLTGGSVYGSSSCESAAGCLWPPNGPTERVRYSLPRDAVIGRRNGRMWLESDTRGISSSSSSATARTTQSVVFAEPKVGNKRACVSV